MKDIFILGSGGFAREVYFLLKIIGGYNFRGFINKERLSNVIFGNEELAVFSEEEFLMLNNKNTALAIGTGNPMVIESLRRKFDNYYFPNLFHPTVTGDFENIEIGRGNIFTANVTMTTCIKIGDFNVFNLLSTIGHDVVIGDCNVVNPSVNISGGVRIGNSNFLGVSSTILQNKTIGNSSIVGASSLVVKNVPDSVTVVGVPAKKMQF
jgi:sugar O-acyltransferase (sialic acid O-acetyltransferase NeuD family)